jgi:hypothetical protein
MANVQRVLIKGWMPYDVCARSQDACIRLGVLNSPSYGLHITYGKLQYRHLKEGGEYAYYEFTISGEEAIWTKFGVHSRSIAGLVEDLVDGGAVIEEVKARDIEEEGEGELYPVSDLPTGEFIGE